VTSADSRRIPYQLEAVDTGDIAAIHAATLRVLSEAGSFFEDQEAVDLLVSAGAASDAEGRVRIPGELVERAIASAPDAMRLYTREGEEALRLEPGHVYCGTGSDCPKVLDFGTGERRPATKRDIELFTRLSDALPNIDFILSMGLASDVPTQTADLHHFQAMVTQTSKPIFFTAVVEGNLERIIHLAGQIAGSQQALEERPFLAHFAMPSPPLRHSKVALQNLITCARHSMPVVYASGTQVGASGPMSLAGSTVSSNCDVLGGLVVHQLANPGAPFIYGVCVAPLDMRTTIECYGAPEHFLGDVVNVQTAQSYGMPTWGYAGNSDAKVLDLQAALEYCGSTLMGLLSHCNLLHDVGYLESGLVASCESIVFGNEVVELARRTLQRVPVDEESLAEEAIKRLGPGGTFLMEEHTVKHMRDFWYSPLIDRRRYEQWVGAGRQTMSDRLRERTREILSSHEPVPLDRSILKSMDAFIAARDREAAGT
jgi:trimethylamine--corrinoid protein Co-methyltransferase